MLLNNRAKAIVYISPFGIEGIMPSLLYKPKEGYKTKRELEMKENKEYQLKVRLTNSEKAMLAEYAQARNLTISDVVRTAIFRMIGEQTK